MKLRNKNGFITIYAMLAMMFFVVFVVVATVTASRKLKLQTEANSALIDIYNKNIESINKTNEDTIPIYTQAQFEYIATWIANLSNASNPSETEYMYINDEVYKLDTGRYDDTGDTEHDNYTFELKTDLWFEGEENDGTDKDDYPYIPDNNDYHMFLKNIINIAQSTEHFAYLKIDDTKVLYGQIIEVTTAEEFIKIGTDQNIGKRKATKDATYRINNYINLEGVDLKKYGERPDFNGKIIGNGQIIDNLKIDIDKNIFGLFKTNTGIIDGLRFVNVEVSGNNETINDKIDLGIISQTNEGTISNCHITISNQSTEDFCQIEVINSFRNVGIITATNKGTINTCSVQAVDISFNQDCNHFGVIAGENIGEIKNIEIKKCSIETMQNGKAFATIGGVCGLNTSIIGDENSKDIKITELNINLEHHVQSEFIGGIVGKNQTDLSSIKNVEIDNINIVVNKYPSSSITHKIGGIAGYNEGSLTNVEAIGSITDGANVGLICGENNGSITTATANGTTNGTDNVGLICGKNNSGKSIGSSTTSTISAIGSITGGENVGLICGNNAGSVNNVSAAMASGGTVSGTDNVAIICGYNSGTISTVNSAKGTISGGVDRGIVCGENVSGATINGASNIIGSINGGTNVGLICGNNAGSVTNVSAAMVSDSTVSGTDNVAIICGYNSGSIENVNSAKGTVSGGTDRGIVCGENSGKISITRDVIGTISGGTNAGLICGLNTNTNYDTSTLSNNPIYDVQANGTINDGQYLGLVCGKNQGGIANAIVTGKIQGNGDDVGGVVGLNDGFIKNAIVNAEIRGQDAGGIVGNVGYSGNGTTIENCYSNVLFEIGTRKDSAGGIVGWVGGMPLTISNCAYVNEIKVGYSYIGGIVACMNQNVTISSCYMNGKLPTKGNNVQNDYGAIVGTKNSGTLSLTNVWYNQTYPWKTNAIDWNGTPKSSGELDTQITTLFNTINSNIGS